MSERATPAKKAGVKKATKKVAAKGAIKRTRVTAADKRSQIEKERLSAKARQAIIMTYVITAVWAISFLVDIMVKTYDPPPAIHAAMMVAAGGTFSQGVFTRKSKG